jgi:cytochrome c
VWGRRSHSEEDFGYYSAELKSSGIVWSEERLSESLSDPAKLVPGTEMTTVSIKDPNGCRDIIGFIKRQDKSVDLCF